MNTYDQEKQLVEKKRILIVSSIDISLFRFRGKLIELLKSHGYEVYLVAPSYTVELERKLNDLGAVTITVPMSRSGISVKDDFRTYRYIKKVIKNNRIDLVFPYTIKPVMYSSLAGAALGVPVVGLVNGLGYMFTGNSIRQNILRAMVLPVYRRCVRKNKAMIFQNSDDLEYFKTRKLLGKKTITKVVAGSGVDLEEFAWREPRKEDNLRFCFVGRLLVENGIRQFIDVARSLKRKWPKSEFHVFGDIQPGSSNSLSKIELEEAIDSGSVVFHGRVDDIGSELAKMDVIVFPSWYREGVPRSLLEALSKGLAVVTTDTPGCREVVNNGVNGYLISPKDLDSLESALVVLLQNPALISRMSRYSREIAANRFDVHLVNKDISAVFCFAFKKG